MPSKSGSDISFRAAALAAVFAAMPALQACVAPPPQQRQPIINERPQPSMQRLIVQYGEGNPEAHESRIFAALQGVPFTVVNNLRGGRTIIIETNEQGLRRLQALPGIAVNQDSVSGPTN